MTVTARHVVGWAAVLGTFPYLALKFAWLAGSTVGVIDTATFADRSVLVLNAVTAAMDLVAIVVALAFTYRWGQRVPGFLVLAPIWVGTGFLAPIVVLAPLTGFTLGAPQTNPVLEPWVQPLVYSGFGWQGVTLMIAFVLYARARWPWVFEVDRVAARPLSVLLGDAGAVLGVVAGVSLLWDGPAADMVLGAMALLAAAGVVVLVHGVRCRFWVPVTVTWLGAGSMFSWGLWALVNTVGDTALSGGAGVPPDVVAAALGGCLIGVGSLLLLSGFSAGRAGRTAPS